MNMQTGFTRARPLAMAACAALLVAAPALADPGGRMMKASLDGWQEVPSVSSTGSGELLLRAFDDGTGFEYALEFRDLEGTVSASHIHLGQPGVNGGVSVFLCGGGGAPACPAGGGSVQGMVTADAVVGPAGQGIAAGEFEELVMAIRAGVTYVNVHSDKHPGGEIRGAIR